MRRWLFGLQPVGPLPAIVGETSKAQHRIFGGLGVRLDLDPHELRLDRHAMLSLSARLFPSIQDGHQASAYLNLRASGVRPIGWHELWLRLSGTALLGEVPFPDEEALGAYVHGPFGGDFARKIVMAGGEFRYSLLRDLIKVGPYLETLAFGEVDRTTAVQTPRGGAVLGIVAGGLFLDQFVFEFYFGMGALTNGESGGGVALAIRQAY
jgi:hypothetical protein